VKPPQFELHPYVASFVDDKVKPEAIVDAILAEGREEVIRAFLLYGVIRAINELKHQRRTTLKRTGKPHRATEKVTYLQLSKRTKRHAMVTLHGILASWMVGDTPLGLTTKKRLRQEVEKGDRQIRGVSGNNDFYRTLMQKMRTDESVVVEAWTEKQVDALRDSIWGTR
jgi:hypothetical protein